MIMRNKITMWLLFMFVLASLVSALTVYDVSTVEVGSSVNVNWLSDVEADGTVFYGINSLENNLSSDEIGTMHSITLTNLEASSEYSYEVESCNNETCDRSEMFFFIAPNSSNTSTNALPLTVTLNGNPLPEFYNSNKISFDVESASGSDIYIKVNGAMKRHKRLGDSGRFTFTAIELDPDLANELTVSTELGSDSKSEAFTINLDLTYPSININSLPEEYLQQVFDVNGTTDEDVVLDVYMSYRGEESILTNTLNIMAGTISESISFSNGDGNYNVQFVFTDKAGNRIVKEFNSYIDTENPPLETDPGDLNRLGPSYVDKIRIQGTTEPGAKVVVYVNNKTSTKGSWNADFLSIVQKIGLLFEGEREYITVAGDDGSFAIDVYLSKKFIDETYMGQRFTNQQVFGRNVTERVFTNVPAWVNNIMVVAIDRAGRTSETRTARIILTTCDYGGDWQVDFQTVTPNVIIPNHLLEGIGGFGFNYKLEWQGPGDEMQARIVGKPDFRLPSNSVLSQMDEEAYKLGMLVIDRGSFINMYQNDLDMGTVKVNLKRYPGTEEELADYNNLEIMMEMELNYKFDNFGQPSVGRQIKCVPVSIPLDKRLDVAKPKKFLKKAVGFLEGTVDTLDDVIEVVQDVRKVVFYSSLATTVVYYGYSVKQKLACWKYAGTRFVPKDGDSIILPTECDGRDDADDCNSCWGSIISTEKMKRTNSWVSDRIFCPAIPSVQEYTRTLGQRDYFVYDEGDGDSDDKNLIHRDSACTEKSLPTYYETKDERHDNCKSQYHYEWRPACLSINDIYKYSFNESEQNFFEKFVDTVDGVCKANPGDMEDIIHKTGHCCDNHNYNKEYPSTTGCYYIINPSQPEGTEKGIYEAFFDEQASCLRDSKGDCIYENGQIISDPNKQLETVELYYDNNGLPFKVDKVNGYDSEAEYKAEMNDRCLGFYIDGYKGKYVIDPTSSLIRSAQCGCMPALEQYLIHYRNMADGTRKCFEEILMTGNATAGFCKTMITQYICDLVYDVIRCGGKFFSAKLSIGSGEQRPQDESPGIGGFFAAMNSAGSSVANSVKSRYGTTQMFRSLFSERTLLHSACIAAFTGDWNVEMENLFSLATSSIPIKSDIFIHPATRRFITSSPFNGRATYIYHINMGIIAGADMSFTARLVCSAENTCNTPTGECDCFRSGVELSAPTGVSGNLRNGEMWSKDAYIEIPNAGVRYDKLVVTYIYRNNQGQQVTEMQTKRITLVGGVPATCNFDIMMAQFLCQFDIGDRGFASFGGIAPRIALGSTYGNYRIGDKIILDGQVIKRSPGYNPNDPTAKPIENKNVWLKAEVKADGVTNVIGGRKEFMIINDGTHELDRIFADMNLVVQSSWFASTTPSTTTTQGFSAVASGNLENDVRVTVENDPEDFSRSTIEITTTEGVEILVDGNIPNPSHKYGKESYDGYFEFFVDDEKIVVSGQPDWANSRSSQTLVVKKTSSEGRQFKLMVSLHYSDEADQSRIDFLHPIVNGGIEEEYEITFTATPTDSANIGKCLPASRWHGSETKCKCGDGTCPIDSDYIYCYRDNCVDEPACEATRHLDNPTEENSKIIDKDKCYCNPTTPSADWQGDSEKAGGKVSYCYIKGDETNPRVHTEFSNAAKVVP